jgi:hypothetical protein
MTVSKQASFSVVKLTTISPKNTTDDDRKQAGVVICDEFHDNRLRKMIGDDEKPAGAVFCRQKTSRRMMLERGAHSNWAKNAWALENGRESGYD